MSKLISQPTSQLSKLSEEIFLEQNKSKHRKSVALFMLNNDIHNLNRFFEVIKDSSFEEKNKLSAVLIDSIGYNPYKKTPHDILVESSINNLSTGFNERRYRGFIHTFDNEKSIKKVRASNNFN